MGSDRDSNITVYTEIYGYLYFLEDYEDLDILVTTKPVECDGHNGIFEWTFKCYDKLIEHSGPVTDVIEELRKFAGRRVRIVIELLDPEA